MLSIAKASLADNSKMRFDTVTGSGHSFVMDTKPEFGGEDKGPLPKELPFAGLAGCTGMDVTSLMRKMRQDFTKLEVEIEGLVLAEEHPKYWKEIRVIFTVDGEVEPEKLKKAINLSRTTYCSVSASLSDKMAIHYRYVLNGETVDLPDAGH